MRGLPSILSLFFATSLINSVNKNMNVRLYLSYDIKITLKSHFCRKNLINFVIKNAMLLWTS